MAAPLALAIQVKRATHTLVQVRIDGVPITVERSEINPQFCEWSEINHPFRVDSRRDQ